MTRLILAAGVAALAIAAPASARPGDHGPKAGGQAQHGGGAARPAAAERRQGGGQARQAPQHAARPERTQSMAMTQRRQDRPQPHAQAARPSHQPAHARDARPAQQVRQARAHANAARQQAQAHADAARQQAQARQDMRAQQAQNRAMVRGQAPASQFAANNGKGYGVGGCPPGLGDKGCMPPGQAAKLALQDRIAVRKQLMGVRQLPLAQRVQAISSLGPQRFVTLRTAPTVQVLDPMAASALVGVPLSTAATVAALTPLPQPIQYLYPETPNYYYQYGNGYVYQVDRGSNLINALIPLLTGYTPGSYLPPAYMSSYVPDYYGYNSFYPSSYGYGGLCNRYAYGVVYQVDCGTGMVESVIPTYAGGYGVGQLLPTSYSYYNVPYQYRSLYPSGGDTGYWYAPGAIYQYDRGTSLITSVAALLSPGFNVGQPLPAGYGVYNVPYSYRSTYYDTASDWYRYNNGYIYRVDPTTMLVTAIVASALS